MKTTFTLLSGIMVASLATAAPVTVFQTDFDGGALSVEIAPGTALLTGVQGFAGLGPVNNSFSGDFLRSETGNVVTLSLTGLPPHNSLNMELLFAAIDSLDGTGTFPQGDFFNVVVDGVTVFSESFANATAGQIQSYQPPPGVELARRVDLGFSGPGGFYTDSAYNLGLDPVFAGIPHSAASVTLQFFIAGEGIQDINDESWAMDNLRIVVDTTAVVDSDNDGVPDTLDNCVLVANADQRDSNGDGIGNFCDADLNNDCVTNALDLGLFKAVFFSTDPHADFNGDGIVNAVDLGIFRALFFRPPGPSGLSNTCTP